jgi:hypothetical protein
MASLLERKDSIRIVRQLSDQQNLESLGRRRRVGSLSRAPVEADLVDHGALGGLKAQRVGNPVAFPEDIEAAGALADRLVHLPGVLYPLSSQCSGSAEAAMVRESRPEQAVQIVAHQLLALDPALVDSPVQHLDELKRKPLDLA